MNHMTDKVEKNSAFYIGHVFHKRYTPKIHQFSYPLYMTFLDLDETETLQNKYWWFSTKHWAPLQLQISDYFNSSLPKKIRKQLKSSKQKFSTNHSTEVASQLKQTAIIVAQSLGAETHSINRVCMLANLRSFGFYFSPVNFFFLYEGSTAKYMIAEVSNTPWNKKHCYLVSIKNPQPSPKHFHVSPFMDLDMIYQWVIKPPQKKTLIRIENWKEKRVFSAVFSAQRHEINLKSICTVLFKWPVITISIIRRIYWQAFKLIIKGIHYVPYQTKK